MIKKIFATIILLYLIPTFAIGITREAAVEYALKDSEAIRMIMESSKTLRSRGEQNTAFSKPRVTWNAGYLEMGDNAPENPMFPSPDRDISAEIQISKLFYAGGRIGKVRDLEKNLNNQADLLEISGKRDIRKQVRMAFDTVLYQKAALDILKDRVEQRLTELEDAQDLREAGMVTSLDVRQAKLSLNFAKNELKSGEASYRESLINFNLAIGRSGDAELLIPEGNLEDTPNLEDILSELNALLSAENILDIKSAGTQADAARLNYEIARGEELPEVLLMASGKSGGEEPDDMDESWNIGIQARWNIIDGGLVRARTASAKADMRKAKENVSKTKKAMAGEVEKIGVNIRSLEQRIRLQREAVELSEKNYEDARGHYRAGMITLTRLGEFNLSYAEARFNLLGLFFLQREQMNNAEALLEK
ncbi:TolC family protein [Desulfonema magnum]|uniref:Outer membrane efflux protein n=1 Tax=Desulfonema magnum TaxID=45655 RepID=A0A975GSB6_9BACT|nr:TolC family protein [Desulfonema magnum]QTA91901.1 Outer membrane efflux protein [Desulfonema magnum]